MLNIFRLYGGNMGTLKIDDKYIIVLLEKLIGDIDPVGITHVDDIRLENLKLWCNVAEYMIVRMYEVSDSPSYGDYSIQKIKDEAQKHMDSIKEFYFNE